MPTVSRIDSNDSSRTSTPDSRTEPESVSYKRGSNDAIVDLPAPDAPTSAINEPGAASNDTPPRISSPPRVSSDATSSKDASDTLSADG